MTRGAAIAAAVVLGGTAVMWTLLMSLKSAKQSIMQD